MSAECDPSDFRDRLPDRPWVIMGLLPALAVHGEPVEWLGNLSSASRGPSPKSLLPVASA